MGYLDQAFSQDLPANESAFETSYETRELAWELAQPRVDTGRIRFLVEMGAVPGDALRLAQLTTRDVARHPQLKGLRIFDDYTPV